MIYNLNAASSMLEDGTKFYKILVVGNPQILTCFFFLSNLFSVCVCVCPSVLRPLSFCLSGLCDNIIQDIIYGFLVLPNSIKIPLVGEDQLAALRFPIPKVAHTPLPPPR